MSITKVLIDRAYIPLTVITHRPRTAPSLHPLLDRLLTQQVVPELGSTLPVDKLAFSANTVKAMVGAMSGAPAKYQFNHCVHSRTSHTGNINKAPCRWLHVDKPATTHTTPTAATTKAAKALPETCGSRSASRIRALIGRKRTSSTLVRSWRSHRSMSLATITRSQAIPMGSRRGFRHLETRSIMTETTLHRSTLLLLPDTTRCPSWKPNNTRPSMHPSIFKGKTTLLKSS